MEQNRVRKETMYLRKFVCGGGNIRSQREGERLFNKLISLAITYIIGKTLHPFLMPYTKVKGELQGD